MPDVLAEVVKHDAMAARNAVRGLRTAGLPAHAVTVLAVKNADSTRHVHK